MRPCPFLRQIHWDFCEAFSGSSRCRLNWLEWMNWPIIKDKGLQIQAPFAHPSFVGIVFKLNTQMNQMIIYLISFPFCIDLSNLFTLNQSNPASSIFAIPRRQELSSLEDLTGQTVATLSGYPRGLSHSQRTNEISQISEENKGSRSTSPPILIRPPPLAFGLPRACGCFTPTTARAPQRSRSTPQLGPKMPRYQLQHPVLSNAPPTDSTAPSRRVSESKSAQRVQPKDFAQTPPQPRPLFRL